MAPYLGCLVTRPDPEKRWKAKEHPREFDRLLEALGAEVVDYPLRTDCCGGHLSQISPGMGLEMIRRLLDSAERLGADVLATICPMCQMNIDLYQAEVNRRFKTDFRIPILFFTQLVGLAFGMEAKALGIGSEVVSAEASPGEDRHRGAGARGGRAGRRRCRARQAPGAAGEEGPGAADAAHAP